MTERSFRSPWPVFACTSAAVVAIDIASKWAITRWLGPGNDRSRYEIIPSVVDLTFSRNSGIAFGLMRENDTVVWVLVVVAMLGIAVVALTSLRTAGLPLAMALGLVLGGGIANLIDRSADNRVVDFVDISRWPSFNVADAAITIGVATLAMALLREEGTARE